MFLVNFNVSLVSLGIHGGQLLILIVICVILMKRNCKPIEALFHIVFHIDAAPWIDFNMMINHRHN